MTFAVQSNRNINTESSDSENWDADFDFYPGPQEHVQDNAVAPIAARDLAIGNGSAEWDERPSFSVASSGSFNEDWDVDTHNLTSTNPAHKLTSTSPTTPNAISIPWRSLPSPLFDPSPSISTGGYSVESGDARRSIDSASDRFSLREELRREAYISLEQTLSLSPSPRSPLSPSQRLSPSPRKLFPHLTRRASRSPRASLSPTHCATLGMGGKEVRDSLEDVLQTERTPVPRKWSFSFRDGKKKPEGKVGGVGGIIGGLRRLSVVAVGRHRRSGSVSGSGEGLFVTSAVARKSVEMRRAQTPDVTVEQEQEQEDAPEPTTPKKKSGHSIAITSTEDEDKNKPLDPTIPTPTPHPPTEITSEFSPTPSLPLPRTPLPHSYSLGRAALPASPPSAAELKRRRSSMGDLDLDAESTTGLKIPERIAQKQDRLKKDLDGVREFSEVVNEILTLQRTYTSLLHSPRLDSQDLKRVGDKYSIEWECATLLVELGTGEKGADFGSPLKGKGKEVLRGRMDLEEQDMDMGYKSLPTSPVAGQRYDLSQRQVRLLKEMLGYEAQDEIKSFSLGKHGEDATTDRRSSFTSERVSMDRDTGLSPSSSRLMPPVPEVGEGRSRRRSSRLGMRAIRDALRALRRSHLPYRPESSQSNSLNDWTFVSPTTSRSPDRSPTQVQRPRQKIRQRKRAETVTLYSPALLATKVLPRRPSLASVFHIKAEGESQGHGKSASVSTMDDDHQQTATVQLEPTADSFQFDTVKQVKTRPRTPVIQLEPTIFDDLPFDTVKQVKMKPGQRVGTTLFYSTVSNGSPLEQAKTQNELEVEGGKKLAMTPENIIPLLQSAREVALQLRKSIEEMKGCLGDPRGERLAV